MKTITTLFLFVNLLFFSNYSFAGGGEEDGQSCITAYSQLTDATANYSFKNGQEKLYIKFTATASDIYFGFLENNLSPTSEIHRVELFKYMGCEGGSLLFSRTENTENSIKSFLAKNLEIEEDYLMVISRDVNLGLPASYFTLQGIHFLISPCPSNYAEECWNDIKNGDFTYTAVNMPDNDSAFNYNEVCEWSVGLATPQYIYKDNSGNLLQDPYAELHYVQTYTQGVPAASFQVSEGTMLHYNVATGDELSIIQDLRITNLSRRPQDFRITLINQSTIDLYGANFNVEDILTLPSNQKQDVVIAQGTELSQIWQSFQKCITASGNFDRIIFYPLTFQNTSTFQGQVHQDKVKVQAMEVDAGADVTADCDQSVTIGPSCVIPGAIYSWSPTQGLSDPNIANPKVYKDGDQNYTVTVSYPCGNGQFYTFSDQVTVFKPIYDIIIPDGEDMSYLRTNYPQMFSSQHPNDMYYKSINVEGTFTINEEVSFPGCDFYMGEGAKIIIKELVRFDGYRPSFQTCDPNTFWDGIYIDGNDHDNYSHYVALHMHSREGKFSNAMNGIVLSNGAGFTLEDYTFDRNNKCITIKNYGSHFAGFFTPIMIYENKFQCSSPLVNASGQEYYPTTSFEIDSYRRPYSNSQTVKWGMWFQPNTFYGTAGKVYVKNSNVDMDRLRFYDYNNQYALPGAPQVVEQAMLIEADPTGNYTSDIKLLNCQYVNAKNGLKLSGEVIFDLLNSEANVDASGNGYAGISGSNFLTLIDNHQPTVIDNNTINNVQTGIFAFNTTDLTISNNNFDLETQPGTGYKNKVNHNSTAISINNVSYTGSNAIVVDVLDNLIVHAKRGIYAQFTDASILNNTILDLNDTQTQPTNCFPNPTCPPSPAYGIRAINSINSYTIQENKVELDLAKYSNPYPSANTDVVGIDVENTMSAYNTLSDISCNKVKGTGIGMRFAGTNDPLTQITYNSMQDHKYGFVLANNGYVGNVGQSGYASDNEWNGTYISSHTLSDNSNGANCKIFTRSGGTTANGGVFDPSILFSHVLNNGVMIQKDNSGNLPHSPLCTIRTRLHSSSESNHQLSKVDKAEAFKIRKQLLKGEMPYMVDKVKSAAALNQQLIYHKSLNNVAIERYIELEHFSDSMGNTSIGRILSQNKREETQVSTNKYDRLINEVNVLQNIINNGIALDHKEWNTLKEIAASCPYEDGIAVYYARAILEKQEKIFILNECELTKEEDKKSKEIAGVKAWNETNFKLYPNPSNGQITIDYIVESNKNVTLNVFDIVGKKHKEVNLSVGMVHQVDLGNMHLGIYFYRLSNENEVFKSGKLIIE